MYSHILIAIDGSELAARGLEQGLALAKALGSRVTVLTASEPWTAMGVDAAGLVVTEYSLLGEYEKDAAKAGEVLLSSAATTAANLGVEVQTTYAALTHPADAIIDFAEKNAVDLIVMASHGRRGLQRVFLGSQTAEVVTRSTVPVLVVR
jgi:nucleotide-binding universal stress UspA family protein